MVVLVGLSRNTLSDTGSETGSMAGSRLREGWEKEPPSSGNKAQHPESGE